jgi:hypothetical protein
MDENTCKYDGCTEQVHAKGYCRRHYAKIWREKGKASAAQDKSQATRCKGAERAQNERYRALKFELDNARLMYNAVIGAAARIKWMKRIRWLEEELTRMDKEAKAVLSRQRQTPSS